MHVGALPQSQSPPKHNVGCPLGVTSRSPLGRMSPGATQHQLGTNPADDGRRWNTINMSWRPTAACCILASARDCHSQPMLRLTPLTGESKKHGYRALRSMPHCNMPKSPGVAIPNTSCKTHPQAHLRLWRTTHRKQCAQQDPRPNPSPDEQETGSYAKPQKRGAVGDRLQRMVPAS